MGRNPSQKHKQHELHHLNPCRPLRNRAWNVYRATKGKHRIYRQANGAKSREQTKDHRIRAGARKNPE